MIQVNQMGAVTSHKTGVVFQLLFGISQGVSQQSGLCLTIVSVMHFNVIVSGFDV